MVETDQETLGAAKAPRGVGSAPLVAQLIALGLAALGAVGIQEALVRAGAVAGRSWSATALDAVDGTPADAVAVLVVGSVLVLLGVAVLPTAFRRRPRTSVALATRTGVFLRSEDVARVLAAALDGAEDVTDVRLSATRRRVRVRATTYAPRAEAGRVKETVVDRLAPVLDALHRRPRVRVRLRHQGDDR